MSLHVLANHMASKGRGEDSMLVHMTPREVAGLQALALKHGGSLTINPDTGLVEAGWLSKLLPMIAGFALGPAGFGLMSAAGAGLTVGAVTGLATGSLSKGLMAGLGAYGGAGLGEAFAGAGTGAISSEVGKNAIANAGLTGEAALGTEADQIAANAIKDKLAGTSLTDKLGAGFNAVTKDASTLGNFAKDNWKLGLAAASPMIADAMVPTTTKMPSANQVPGYIRPYQYDANTRTVTAQDPVLASEWGARQFPSFIPKKFDTGGIVALAEGGEPSADPFSRYNNLTGQSKAAYDYLMGNSAVSNTAPPIAIQNRPVVSNTNAPVVAPAAGLPSGGVQDSPTTIVEPSAGIPTLIQPPEITPVETPVDTPDYIAPPDSTEIPDYIAPPDVYTDIPDYIAPPDQPVQIPDYIAPPDQPVEMPDYIAPPDVYTDIPDYTAPEDTGDKSYWDDSNAPEQVGPNRGQPELPDEFDQYIPTPDYIAPPDQPVEMPDYIAPQDLTPVQVPDYIAPQDQAPVEVTPPPSLDDYIRDYIAPVDTQPIYPDVPADPSDYIAPVDTQPTYPDAPEYPNDYEVQPWENVDDSGYTDNTMAGDNSLYSQNNTYIAPPESVQQDALPDDFGGMVAPPAYTPEPAPYVPEPVRDNAPDIQPYVQEPAPYVPAEEPRAPTYQDIYRPEEPVTPAEERQAAIDEYLYGGGGGGGGRTDNMLAEYGGGDFGGDFGGYGNYGENMFAANGGLMGYAAGGLGSLGGFSDGGRLLKGPGDGVSDSIPAMIGAKGQPARLADGEFVVPARIVSELGNGSTEAGARKLYAMMDRIQKARGKTVGKGKVATNSRAEQHLPA